MPQFYLLPYQQGVGMGGGHPPPFENKRPRGTSCGCQKGAWQTIYIIGRTSLGVTLLCS